MWKEKRAWSLPSYYLRLSTLLKYSAVWWLWLQHWYGIYRGFFGTNLSSLSSWMQSHTNLALLTNMPRKNARWLQHPCLCLIFREAFQNPSLLNKNTKQLLILEEKKNPPKFVLNLSAIYTKITSFWSLHSTAFLMDACERRKQTWSTDIFVKSLHWFHCHTAMGTYGL